jgi:hypothetical protein
MNDEQITTDTDTITEENTPAWYRDQMAKKDAELKELQKTTNRQRVKLMESTFKAVGLDPAKGLGKAIAKEFDGEPDAEQLRQFAIEEYGWEPPTPENPQAEVVVEAQGRVQAATAGADSVPVQPIDFQIQEAEEKGDFASAVSLKVQKYRNDKGI